MTDRMSNERIADIAGFFIAGDDYDQELLNGIKVERECMNEIETLVAQIRNAENANLGARYVQTLLDIFDRESGKFRGAQ